MRNLVRTNSLEKRMIFLMAAIAIVQCVVLILCVYLTGVYRQLDSESYRFFSNDAAERALSIDGKIGTLIRNIAAEANSFNSLAQKLAQENNIDIQHAYQNDDFYLEFSKEGAIEIEKFINANLVSGAFFLLDGSNFQKDDPSAHSGVYIKDTAPAFREKTEGNLELEIGPSEIVKDSNLLLSSKWDLDVIITHENPLNFAFYEEPLEAVKKYPHSEIERYGYWARPAAVLNNSQPIITYTLPLIDDNGEPYGVLGLELSLNLFMREYLSSTNMPFANGFFSVMHQTNDVLDTDWFIADSPTAQQSLENCPDLKLNQVDGTSLYATDMPNVGAMYCAVHQLSMYSKNSPFINESWTLVGFVPQNDLTEISRDTNAVIVRSMLITTCIAFLAIVLIAHFSTRKVRHLSRYIDNISGNDEVKFPTTDLKEIDDLTEAIAGLNKRVAEAAQVTSKMLELTQLPLGGFEVNEDLDQVVVTEFVYELLQLEPDSFITKTQWNEIYNNLVKTPAKGYDDIYKYQPFDGERTHWLRILEAPTDTGKVGMILDVTKDIEEHRRLSHELDYDALTHLYNRLAFKREAYRMVIEEPGKIGAMIFSDLDNLKYINDTFGHEMGDKLITTAADMFRQFQDYGGIVARISGDEFAIFMYGYDSKDEILKIVRKLFSEHSKRTLETPDGKLQKMRYSSGIAWYPQDSNDLTDLLKLSDYAMYEAKHSQKGTLMEFSEESYNINSQILDNREAINKLIDDGLVRFAYQPIIDLKSGNLIGYEALMRSMIKEFKSPEQVIQAASDQAKLNQLEKMLIFKAFEQVENLKSELNNKKIFINSFANHELSRDDLSILTKKYADVFNYIGVELDSRERINPGAISLKLNFIKDHDIPLIVDNFGVGFTHEPHVIEIQPTILKIDPEWILGIAHNWDKHTLAHNTINFCKSKNIKTIAVGVENQEDLEAVIELDFDFAQGFYIGKPLYSLEDVSEEVIDFILNRHS